MFLRRQLAADLDRRLAVEREAKPVPARRALLRLRRRPAQPRVA